MRFKKFKGDKAPPLGACIPAMKKNPQSILKPRRWIKKHYSMMPWKNDCLNQTVQIIDGQEKWACYICGTIMNLGQTTIDHVIPLSKGGTYASNNLRPCCLTCNNLKADTIYENIDQILNT